jgi:hypothetical protein
VSDEELGAFQQPPGSRGESGRSSADPVSWLQIEQGWRVETSDGQELGTVAQVAGTTSEDIFDGLAVDTAGGAVVYVPGEQVGLIYPGRVTLRIDSAAAGALGPYTAAPPETVFHAGGGSLKERLARWLGRR